MSWQRATVYKNTVTECLTNKLVKCSVNSATDYSILTTLAYWVYIKMCRITVASLQSSNTLNHIGIWPLIELASLTICILYH